MGVLFFDPSGRPIFFGVIVQSSVESSIEEFRVRLRKEELKVRSRMEEFADSSTVGGSTPSRLFPGCDDIPQKLKYRKEEVRGRQTQN
jgi:hypothetical protein